MKKIDKEVVCSKSLENGGQKKTQKPINSNHMI
jgi:hypothetical protein